MSNKLAEFESALLIDKHDLDEEITKQADLVYRVGIELSLAISRRDAAKTTLAETEADVELTIRKSKEDKRCTDKEVAARVRMHPHVKAATENLRVKQKLVNRWTTMEKSITARGHALRELVKLYVDDYYASAGEVRADNRMKDVTAARARKAMHEQRVSDGGLRRKRKRK